MEHFGFSWNLICEYFSKTAKKIQVALKSEKNNGYFTWRCSTFIISHSVLLRIGICSNKNCRENQNTHFMFNNLFHEAVPFMKKCGNIWQSRVGHRRQYNTVYVLCMLDN
jgi:hypothetical protein